ncbi:hypothetical protein [Methylobacterium dankookense]|uniref:Uncharacterized protein n=1 Tax=Methylobacterium dankookense TaxID=560405 RepID=A0A564FRL7_9HYPH|nr:hypothetical protein [Methylobacterium dankookense]GJD58000.1 hypothetical protein IFDJLNFL_3914 [Methylobacterium dankookense]VUF10458.1 hypothetical protein MTDSW087_00125 [Methylobacterium dankookense]
MSERVTEIEQAVERLSFFMLKEVYCSATAAMMKLNPDASRLLFLSIDKLITNTIAGISQHGLEGEHSTEIAIAVGNRIAEVLDRAHHGQFEVQEAVKAAAEPDRVEAQHTAALEADVRRHAHLARTACRSDPIAA